MRLWAVRIRYGDYRVPRSKWRRKTTKWYEDPNDAWDEADRFTPPNYEDKASALIHKDI